MKHITRFIAIAFLLSVTIGIPIPGCGGAAARSCGKSAGRAVKVKPRVQPKVRTRTAQQNAMQRTRINNTSAGARHRAANQRDKDGNWVQDRAGDVAQELIKDQIGDDDRNWTPPRRAVPTRTRQPIQPRRRN